MEEGEELHATRDDDLPDEGSEDLLRDQVRGRSFWMDAWESFSSSH